MNSDQKLIVDYLAGDEKSLEILIKRYLKPIYSFVYRYIGDSQNAEDITQEVFIKTWRNLKKFDPRRRSLSPKESLRLPTGQVATLRGRQNKSLAPHRTCSGAGFKTWIFTIAKNTSIDFFKKKKSLPFSIFENEEGENILTETLADSAPLPDKLFERASVGEMLQGAMKQLTPQYRMVLFLHHNDHLTFREISEILGELLNTIKSRHRRALIMLRKLLQEAII